MPVWIQQGNLILNFTQIWLSLDGSLSSLQLSEDAEDESISKESEEVPTFIAFHSTNHNILTEFWVI